MRQIYLTAPTCCCKWLPNSFPWDLCHCAILKKHTSISSYFSIKACFGHLSQFSVGRTILTFLPNSCFGHCSNLRKHKWQFSIEASLRGSSLSKCQNHSYFSFEFSHITEAQYPEISDLRPLPYIWMAVSLSRITLSAVLYIKEALKIVISLRSESQKQRNLRKASLHWAAK